MVFTWWIVEFLPNVEYTHLLVYTHGNQKLNFSAFIVSDKEIYVFGSLCLFISNITKNGYKRIAMKFYGEVQGGEKKNMINFWWRFGSQWRFALSECFV